MLIQVKSNKSIIIIGELEIYSHANIFSFEKRNRNFMSWKFISFMLFPLLSVIRVEEQFTCIKIKMKIVRGTRVLSSYNSLTQATLSLCLCLAITPNLVVSSRLRLKRPVIHRKALPRSIHRTASSFPCIQIFAALLAA